MHPIALSVYDEAFDAAPQMGLPHPLVLAIALAVSVALWLVLIRAAWAISAFW